MSLVAHAIVVGTIAYRPDDSRANQNFIHSTPGLIASIALAKPLPTLKSASPITRSFDNAAEKSVAADFVATPPEEIAEEPPYASPDSIEQMASVIDPPDLPLPSDALGTDGFMRIKVFVNEEGLADNVELLESNFAQDYATTLIGLFQSARFSPGVSNGKAIKSWRIVEIDYSSS